MVIITNQENVKAGVFKSKDWVSTSEQILKPEEAESFQDSTTFRFSLQQVSILASHYEVLSSDNFSEQISFLHWISLAHLIESFILLELLHQCRLILYDTLISWGKNLNSEPYCSLPHYSTKRATLQ